MQRFPEPSSMGIIHFFLLYLPGTWSRATRLDWDVEEDQDVFAWGSEKGKNPWAWFCKPLSERTSLTCQQDSMQGWRFTGWGHNAAAWILRLGCFIFLHNQIHLSSAAAFFFSTSNQVQKLCITELKLQKASSTLSSYATKPSVYNVAWTRAVRPTSQFWHTK